MLCVRSISDRPAVLLGLGALLAVAAFHLWITPSNPPGYHRDEAALSLNAYTVSTGLRDEDGARLPLFFRSFEDYKSPLYPYLLAGVFRITGPDAQVARAFSAVLVLAAVLLLGLLARRLTGRNLIAVIAVVVAGVTPWLFELGRIAIEASTQPLLIVLLLLSLERTSRLERYGVTQGLVAGALVGLLTYSYTGSRLLGPLFAGALVVLAGRSRWRFVIAAWAAFLVALVPMGVYAIRHPGALTARYEATTIARAGGGRACYLGARSRDGSRCRGAGAARVLCPQVHDEWPTENGRFEADIPQLLDQAWADGGTVYIDYDDLEPQTLARWYALVKGIDQSRVVRLDDGGIPPTATIAFGRTQECDYICTRLDESGDYWIARVEGPKSG